MLMSPVYGCTCAGALQILRFNSGNEEGERSRRHGRTGCLGEVNRRDGETRDDSSAAGSRLLPATRRITAYATDRNNQ